MSKGQLLICGVLSMLSLCVAVSSQSTHDKSVEHEFIFATVYSINPDADNEIGTSSQTLSLLPSPSFSVQPTPTRLPASLQPPLLSDRASPSMRSQMSLSVAASSTLTSTFLAVTQQTRTILSTSASSLAKGSVFNLKMSVSSTTINRQIASPTPKSITTSPAPLTSLTLRTSLLISSASKSILTTSEVLYSIQSHSLSKAAATVRIPSVNSFISSIGRQLSSTTTVEKRMSIPSAVGLTSTFIISSPTAMVTQTHTTQITLTTEGESKEESEQSTTRSVVPARPDLSAPVYIGIVVVGTLLLIATALLIILLCYCFCRRKKYEYNTGNEYRVTVQKWNTHSAHYTANDCDSVSSSRGSSLLSLRSFNSRTKPHYGGVSSSSDRLHAIVHSQMYSTPL